MKINSPVKHVPTIVIGGGQAGLSVGYHLARQGLPFVILDASKRIGDAWRNRWDSLRLFTPARYVGLPGFSFPARGDSFPTKEEMANYLESYADRFKLPVQSNIKVDRLWKEGDHFQLTAGDFRLEADQVIVAMANYQMAKVPSFAKELNPQINQLHSKAYRNPSQLHEGSVLIVGAGNSAADIAIEVARTHPTHMSGKESGAIPFRIESFIARNFLIRLVRFFGHHVLTLDTPIGRKLRPKLLFHAAPLVRVKLQDLTDAGIERVPRVTGVRNGLPLLGDDRTLDVTNVIWCTGYHPGFSWVDLPVFDEKGYPIHERGVVNRIPGLYFVGLHFQYSMTSATVIGIGRDAEYIVKAVNQRAQMYRPMRFPVQVEQHSPLKMTG